MVGHPETLREWMGDSVGWRYADPDNQMLSEIIGIMGGVSLPALDEAIERLEIEGAPAGDELRERRRTAMRLFRSQFAGNAHTFDHLTDFAFAGHVEWIMLRIRAIATGDVLKPLARIGRSIKQGGEKGAAASRQTRRGPESKRAKILAEARAYTGPAAAMVPTIAKRTSATERYVRNVLNKPEL